MAPHETVRTPTDTDSAGPRIVALTGARVQDVVNNFGEPRRFHHFFGDMDGSVPGPQGFMLQLPPSNTGQPHFHRIDQFQVFFGGRGATYQRKPMSSLMVHYSDAYSSYGPFSSGDDTLEFFTLRAIGDGVVAYLPEHRAKKLRANGRNITIDVEVERTPSTGETPRAERLLPEAEPDGLGAWVVTGPADHVLPVPPSVGSGQYVLVLDGTVTHEAVDYGPRSLAWIPRGGELPLQASSPGGASALVLQFPHPATVNVPLPPFE